jgi:ubiquinone/menaquinone biosynthesis C-methylase UbiE
MAFAITVAAVGQPAEQKVGIVDAMRERILAHLALTPGLTVAEIGVGGGWFVVRVAEAIGPNGVVYGTDIDPNAIARLHGRLPGLKQGSAHVELRLCRDARDTALDDLPDASVDIILMVDSLCFDASVPRAGNVAYLTRFLRILRPGGRLVHHMDCRCDVSPEAVIAQFTAAGFSPRVESFDVSPDANSVDADWPCRSEAERRRHAFVASFRKPTALNDRRSELPAAFGRGFAASATGDGARIGQRLVHHWMMK